MKLFPAETSLVVAGAWNPAILTPAWVARHGLGADPETVKVQAFLPAVSGFQVGAPKFGLTEFSYTVAGGSLLLLPAAIDEASLDLLERVLRGVLDQLRHTPLGGLGHNFEFRDEAPEPATVEAFTLARRDLVNHMPAGWAPASTDIAATFANEAGTVLINVQRHFDASGSTIRFNFHHPASTVEEALNLLAGQGGYKRMHENLQFAHRLVRELFGEVINA
ncbi:MAG: hypothetical protein IV094_13795 [Vitreoscilla sp.]|nr:hypothetical protein [Vitreoscilla sp.]